MCLLWTEWLQELGGLEKTPATVGRHLNSVRKDTWCLVRNLTLIFGYQMYMNMHTKHIKHTYYARMKQKVCNVVKVKCYLQSKSHQILHGHTYLILTVFSHYFLSMYIQLPCNICNTQEINYSEILYLW